MRKLLATILSIALVLSMASTLAEAAGKDFAYPTQFDGELTYWIPLNANVAASEASLNDTPFAQYLYEATGIKVNYIHPTMGSEVEGFNLLLASGELPDIIEASWDSYYPAGLDAAIANGLVLDLTEYQHLMPNYMATLASNETWEKMAKTDSGKYAGFHFIRGEAFLQVYAGTIIRRDWLDKISMDVPTTVDEWTQMLTKFRDELGAESPLITRNGIPDIMDSDAFVGAFGVSNGFYINDEGKVAYGRMEEGWKKAIELLAGWYENGLLAQDFITMTGADKNAAVLNGDGGAFFGLTGSGIGVFMNSAKEAGNNEFNLVGAPYPTLEKGTTPEFGHYDNPLPGLVCTISPKSEHIEEAIRLLDYGYSQEGNNLFNFGKEGISYTIMDGEPTYTDVVLKPEGGISIGQGIARVARSSYGGPFVQALGYFLQYLQLDIQKEAVANWSSTNAAKHKLPPLSVSEADSKEFNNIITEVNTFVAEYTSLAIAGDYDLANFESDYVEELKKIGIERAIEIYQQAYDRYLAR
ncbi:MAG: extracellular solute-binding protein [Christensenellales bacterium]